MFQKYWHVTNQYTTLGDTGYRKYNDINILFFFFVSTFFFAFDSRHSRHHHDIGKALIGQPYKVHTRCASFLNQPVNERQSPSTIRKANQSQHLTKPKRHNMPK